MNNDFALDQSVKNLTDKNINLAVLKVYSLKGWMNEIACNMFVCVTVLPVMLNQTANRNIYPKRFHVPS
jgi:hypothetical protein